MLPPRRRLEHHHREGRRDAGPAGRRRRVRLRARQRRLRPRRRRRPRDRGARPQPRVGAVRHRRTGWPAGAARSSRGVATDYGYGLIAHDLDGDGYDDLLVGAPRDGRPRTGSVHLLRGGPDGLSARARAAPRAAGVGAGGLRHAACGWATSTAITTSTWSRAARRGRRLPATRRSAAGRAPARAAAGRSGRPAAPRVSRSATSTTTATRTSSRATRALGARAAAGRRRRPAVARRPPRAAGDADPHHPEHARDPRQGRARRPVRGGRRGRRPRLSTGTPT